MVIKTETPAESEWLRSLLGITKKDLQEAEQRIMKTIQEFAAAQGALLSNLSTSVDGIVSSVAEVSTSIDALAGSVDGVAGDVQYLKGKIEELNSTPGDLSPADQQLLDELAAAAGALAEKVSAANSQASAVAAKIATTKSALADLDAATSPAVPPPIEPAQ